MGFSFSPPPLGKEVEVMRKLMILVAMLAVVLLAASPALAQDDPAVVADAKAKEAKAGGAKPEGELPPLPKAEEKKAEEKKELPKTGGASVVPLAAIAMLIGSGVVGYSVLRSRRSG